ncbi:hypothetical protein RAMDARK_1814 [Rickettsia amblyommatis str. Darkwater]|nr:hypothetical protein RAMDARK_1814 [Rickettsia amblyommatis str. Darkwater]
MCRSGTNPYIDLATLQFYVPCLLQIPLYKIGYARSLIFILYKILLNTMGLLTVL